MKQRPMLGIAMKVGSVMAFVASNSLIKLSASVPFGQQFFLRSAGAVLVLTIVLALKGELRLAIRTRRPFEHLWRGGLGIMSLLLTLYGLAHLPLSEVITIGYGTPFFTVVFGAILLRERVGLLRWAAVTFGAAGVLIVMWPRLMLPADNSAGDDASLFATMAMACSCLTGAIAMLTLRRLGTSERSTTIVLYFFGFSAVIGTFWMAISGWTPLPLADLCILLAAGFSAACAQLLLAQSYKHAELSTIAPFEYVSIVASIAVGLWIFQEFPHFQMIAGAAIIVASGCLALVHERRRKSAPIGTANEMPDGSRGRNG